MVRKIMRDPLFLAQKSIDATEADKQGCYRPARYIKSKWRNKIC